MYIRIDALEKDLLREIFNIGVSKAADAFALLIRNRKAIILTVPDIKVLRPEEIPVELPELEETVLAIKSEVKGAIEGITVLLFQESHIEWIVQNCLSEKDLQHEESTYLRMSLLLEVSNILTGAVLTQFSNILGLDVHGLPPVCIASEKGRSVESIICQLPACQPILLSVKTDFLDPQRIIELPLLIVLDISSLSTILNTIRQKGINDYKFLEKNTDSKEA